MIYNLAYIKDRLGNNYLGISVPIDIVEPYLEELKTIINTGISPYHQSVDLNSFLNVPEYNWFIPDEIKLNNLVWRAGRVWEIFFNKDRRICRVKVGNRYPKNFQIEDFGVSVKPMLFKSEDTYDLIGQGLAIEENLK